MSRYKTILLMYQKSISWCNVNIIWLRLCCFAFSNKERKGIRFQFRNLLSIRLSLASSGRKAVGLRVNDISVTRSFHREANGRHRKSFLFCFTIVRTMEVFHREIWYNRLVEHGIKLLCRCSLLGPWKSMKGIRKLSIACTESAAGLQD